MATIPTKCSWVWRKLLSLRYLMLNLVAWRMGDGSRISFWQEKWLSCGPLLSVLGAGFWKKIGLPLDITVRDFYSSACWSSFTSPSHDRSIRSILPWLQRLATVIPHDIPCGNNQRDSLIWSPSQNSNFTIRSAWDSIRVRAPKAPWRKLLWYKGAMPRFSFTLWLLILNKLPTGDRLARIGIIPSDLCSICHLQSETVNHLFFDCDYSRQVWRFIMEGRVPLQPMAWDNLLPLLLQPAAIQNQELKKCIGALAYYIWLERNYRRFDRSSLSPASLAQMINSALL